MQYAAFVIGGSFLIEGKVILNMNSGHYLIVLFDFFPSHSSSCSGASLVVAIHAVRKGAAAEGMKLRDYIWRGHDPTAVAVMTEVDICAC